jgi:hypothetical protein
MLNTREQNGGGWYDRLINKLTGSNLRDGEKHAILYTNGGFKAASYMGPGTDIIERIRNGVQPLTMSDKTAQAHDIRYSLAQTPDDVRHADKRMVNALQTKKKQDNWFNRKQGEWGIRAKMKLEDLGLMKKGSFADLGNQTPLSDEERALLQNKLSELEQQGFGCGKRRCGCK